MNALQKADLTPEQLKTLAQAGVIPHDTPPAIVQVFAEACRMHDLSPITKEIYLVKYNTKNGAMYHTIVGIDGVRKKAQRTGQYIGLDDLKFNLGQRGEFQTVFDLKNAGKMPVTCTATAWRLVSGVKASFTKTVVFDEFAASTNPKWQQMPWQMIGKVAEMFALKAAFGDEMAGLHIEDERAAFEEITIQAQAVAPQLEAELEKAREHCKTIFEQCRYEEQKSKFMEARINSSQDIAELRACYSDMKEHVEELKKMDVATKRESR